MESRNERTIMNMRRVTDHTGATFMELEYEVFMEWLNSSNVLMVSVFLISLITLPLLGFSLYALKNYRKSTYYVCMYSITVANIILLGTIATSVLMDTCPSIGRIFHGSLMCKLRHFLVNVSSCFAHWTWVLMYVTRCIMVFFPLHARRNGCVLQGWLPIVGVLICSFLTQLWTPILMTELTVRSNGTVASFCDVNSVLIDSNVVRTIAVTETLVTFFIPFALTVLTDISVLVMYRPCHPTFTLIPREDVGGDLCNSSYLKIVSKKNIEDWTQRRHVAIRRCLLMATINLLLTFPNYSLQLLDEFMNLRSGDSVSFFIWADTVAYILYLLQFMLVPLYLYFLRSDLKRGSSRVATRKADLSLNRDSGAAAVLDATN